MSSTQMKGVLCTGNVVFDMLVHPVDQLRWGATTWVDTIGTSMGGNGANTCYAVARLGVPVRLLSVVGDDNYGDEMLAGLRSAGVDIRYVTRAWGASATTVALVKSDGDRLFLHKPGVCLYAFPAPVDFSPALIQGISCYHLANPFALPAFRQHAAESLRRARAAGLMTSLDAAWDSQGRWLQDLGPCLPHVDLLFVNEGEAHMLTGLTDPLESARMLNKAGARTIVVKLGARGCMVLSDGEVLSVPAFEIDVLDTTGAGDCFAGGFLAAIQRGLSPREAARMGNAVGALSVRRVGAVAGLLSWEETREWMGTVKVRS
ncbi:MAG: carbohydrate kinase family protein [Bryobacteraceae bacterium]